MNKFEAVYAILFSKNNAQRSVSLKAVFPNLWSAVCPLSHTRAQEQEAYIYQRNRDDKDVSDEFIIRCRKCKSLGSEIDGHDLQFELCNPCLLELKKQARFGMMEIELFMGYDYVEEKMYFIEEYILNK
jgi:hypothetical protein